MPILISVFGFITILSSLYALKKWGLTAFLIVAMLMTVAFVTLTKVG